MKSDYERQIINENTLDSILNFIDKVIVWFINVVPDIFTYLMYIIIVFVILVIGSKFMNNVFSDIKNDNPFLYYGEGLLVVILPLLPLVLFGFIGTLIFG